MKFLIIPLSIFVLTADINAQNWFPAKNNTDINGYISDLPLMTFRTDSTTIGFLNIVHGRLNTAWYPLSGLTAAAAGRAELFTGSNLQSLVLPGPNLNLLGQDVGYASITNAWPSALYGNVDRAYVSFSNNAFVISGGRQRINWSTNLVWNPNDWFNAYNYFDFDYEERPGTDGLRTTYYFGPVSSMEIALKASRHLDERTYALMYHSNYSGVDYQLQGGIFGQDAALGVSWAGQILGGGFRGEGSGYLPVLNNSGGFSAQDSAIFVVALSGDYTFPSSLYWLTEAIYNGFGSRSQLNQSPIRAQNISAKMLTPVKYLVYTSLSYSFTDLIDGTLAVMYPIAQNSFFAGPTITISASQNVELLILGQFFSGAEGSLFEQTANIFGGRLRYSF
ncbi:MAG: hypothetical protein FWE57_00220 [Chitinispirillia bacterium]|nr:hypothetical protein [Chitinispirillia bacterium]